MWINKGKEWCLILNFQTRWNHDRKVYNIETVYDIGFKWYWCFSDVEWTPLSQYRRTLQALRAERLARSKFSEEWRYIRISIKWTDKFKKGGQFQIIKWYKKNSSRRKTIWIGYSICYSWKIQRMFLQIDLLFLRVLS